MTARTLVLSAGYEPITLVSWQRAVTLLFLDKVEVVEEHDREVRSPTFVLRCPAVVRLRHVVKRPRGPVKFSRPNIYARDRWRCQYCGAAPSVDQLTYDHVVPRAQGGLTSWTNIVTACRPCNAIKGNRTPAQAGMRLRSVPNRPTWVPTAQVWQD